MSGHHTPADARAGPREVPRPARKDLPTLLYHIKPVFQAEVERECARLKGLNLDGLQLGDHFVL